MLHPLFPRGEAAQELQQTIPTILERRGMKKFIVPTQRVFIRLWPPVPSAMRGCSTEVPKPVYGSADAQL